MADLPWAGTSAAPSLKGVNLVRTFGDGTTLRAALQQVTIDLYPGQIVLLMGPSGSGKSTLLAVLSGLLSPDTGRVVALGQDLWQLSDRQREHFRLEHCGFIFQGYNLFPALTARQQLEMVLRWGKGVNRRGAGPMDGKVGAGNGAGVHICTGPVYIRGAEPGDILEVRIMDVKPRPCANFAIRHAPGS